MLITTSSLPYTVGLNRAPDSASTRKLKSNVKSAFTLRAAIGMHALEGKDEKLGE